MNLNNKNKFIKNVSCIVETYQEFKFVGVEYSFEKVFQLNKKPISEILQENLHEISHFEFEYLIKYLTNSIKEVENNEENEVLKYEKIISFLYEIVHIIAYNTTYDEDEKFELKEIINYIENDYYEYLYL